MGNALPNAFSSDSLTAFVRYTKTKDAADAFWKTAMRSLRAALDETEAVDLGGLGIRQQPVEASDVDPLIMEEMPGFVRPLAAPVITRSRATRNVVTDAMRFHDATVRHLRLLFDIGPADAVVASKLTLALLCDGWLWVCDTHRDRRYSAAVVFGELLGMLQQQTDEGFVRGIADELEHLQKAIGPNPGRARFGDRVSVGDRGCGAVQLVVGKLGDDGMRIMQGMRVRNLTAAPGPATRQPRRSDRYAPYPTRRLA